MPIEFDITLTSKDMYRFNMYQMYSGFHGWFSVVISIVIFVMAVRTYGQVEPMYTVLYVMFGIVFLIYLPGSLYLRSKHSLAASEVLRNALHYTVGENGFAVSQGEASAELPWTQIYKLVVTKSNVLVYSSRRNAYIIPREQLGDAYGALVKLAEAKLEKFRLKLK